MHENFWLKSLNGRDHLENFGVDGDNIKVDLREIEFVGVGWIHVTQDRDRWWTIVNAVMNIRVP
jgi:hypothetical protein